MERHRSRSRNPKDFKPSGILGKYENRKNGEFSLYSEPLDSALPNFHWRLFQFVKDESLPIDLHTKSHYVIGRESICDIKINHSSISRQHAVIQFRKKKQNESVPFLIDLNTKEGCFLNGEKIDNARFYELRSKDVITFGSFENEFVLVKGDKLNF